MGKQRQYEESLSLTAMPAAQRAQGLLAALRAPELREVAAGLINDVLAASQAGDWDEMTDAVSHWLAVAEGMAATRRKLRPVLAARKVKGDWRQHLSRHPDIGGGQLCARGTRVPATVILDNLAAGVSDREILKSYPSLQAAHIEAALAYAAALEQEDTPADWPADAD